MNFQELAAKSSDKTRIVIISENAELLNIFQQVAVMNSVSLTAVRNGNEEITGDFVAAQSEDSDAVADFHPTIVLISGTSEAKPHENILRSITGGGILVYPENFTVPETDNYFRKMNFTTPGFTVSDGFFQLETEMGNIPLQVNSEETVKEIPGLLLLSQQVGIMADEFYDALLNLETSN